LTDVEHQSRFARDGFTSVPLLGPPSVQALRDLYASLPSLGGRGFETDFGVDDPERKQAIHEAVGAIVAPALGGLLVDHRPFMTTFLAKWPGDDGALYIHQDWTYLDEQRFRSAVVWIALDDVGPGADNGPLMVLPGSHRVAGELRGTRTSQWYADHIGAIGPTLVPVEVTAGEAVVLDNALVHASPPNRSNAMRLAVAIAVVPVEAELVHASADGTGRVTLLSVDDRFFRDETPTRLQERIPEPWRATGRQVSSTWQPFDLPLAEQLCGASLTGEGQGSGSVGSHPPEPSAGGVGRFLGLVLAAHHHRVSAVVAPGPFVDPSEFAWLRPIEEASERLAAEFAASDPGSGGEDIEAAGLASPSLGALAGTELPNVGMWSAIMLRDNRGWVPGSRERCPLAVELLEDVPGIRSAMYSVLGPWARIEAHRGPNKGVLRAHVGIIVPSGAAGCSLWAGSERIDWAQGRAFVFDDTFEHRVANRTDGWRVSLMVEFDRPLTARLALANRAVQRAFRLHPQVRGARARQRAVQQALDS